MDINKLLHLKPDWAYQPCLYIVRQEVEGNNAFRCGLSGGLQFKDTDRAYGSDKPTHGKMALPAQLSLRLVILTIDEARRERAAPKVENRADDDRPNQSYVNDGESCVPRRNAWQDGA